MTTCADIMTANPRCHDQNASINLIAKTMKEDNIGPVPIVDSNDSMKLLGIITDRDIVVNVIAANMDTLSTLAGSVMSKDPITCRQYQDIEEATKLMEEHQLRRIPVVDQDGKLVGIIAQADIALRLKEPQQTAELVEKISQN